MMLQLYTYSYNVQCSRGKPLCESVPWRELLSQGRDSFYLYNVWFYTREPTVNLEGSRADEMTLTSMVVGWNPASFLCVLIYSSGISKLSVHVSCLGCILALCLLVPEIGSRWPLPGMWLGDAWLNLYPPVVRLLVQIRIAVRSEHPHDTIQLFECIKLTGVIINLRKPKTFF